MRRTTLRRCGAIGVALGLLAPAAGCTGTDEADSRGDIVIAASLELSGSDADLGVAHEHALRLKVDQLNASGALHGRKLRLTVVDNQTDPGVAMAQLTKFSADPAVTAVIVGSCSECVVPGAKLANDRSLPVVSLAPANQVSTPLDERKYVFKVGPNVPDNASALIGELSRNNIKKIGVLSPDDVYGTNGLDATRSEATKAGIEISASGHYRPTDTDLSQPAKAAIAGNPAAIVVWGFPVQASLAAGALRAAGYKGRLFLDASAAGNLFLGGSSAATDGATMVFPQTLAMDDVIATTPAKAARKQWFEDYTSRYGTYHGHASFAADAAQIIVDAAMRAKTHDHAELRTLLESSRVEGLSGPIRMTPNNHSGLMPQALTVLVAHGGRWRLLG